MCLMRSFALLSVCIYAVIVIAIIILHYRQIKNMVVVNGEVLTTYTNKIYRGKMTFDISKTTIRYQFAQKEYFINTDTDMIKNVESTNINLLCNPKKPSEAYIQSFKGLWIEKIYTVLFFTIVLVLVQLFFALQSK